jgi:hypothetical protein
MKVAVMQLRRAPAEPPIPLDCPVKRELEEGDYLVYKLRNDPADPTSGGYDLEAKRRRSLNITSILHTKTLKTPATLVALAATRGALFRRSHLLRDEKTQKCGKN